MRCREHGFLSGLILFAATTTGAFAQSGDAVCFVEQQRIVPATGQVNAMFGSSASLDGDTLAVGAHLDDVGFFDSGSVWIFVLQDGVWTAQANLTASDAAGSDTFGFSVAVQGDTLIVGARRSEQPGQPQNSGAVYVFTRTNQIWTEVQKLVPAGASQGQQFGHSVALDGDTLVAGSEGGQAHVFVRNGSTWSEQQALAVTLCSVSSIGEAVAIDGDTLAVIARGTNQSHGSLYVFERSGTTWTQVACFDNPNTGGNALLLDVDIDGDRLVLGSFHNGFQAGGFLYERTAGVWSQTTALTTEVVEVARIDGDLILFKRRDSPAVIPFQLQGSSWSPLPVFFAPPDSFFATALELDGDRFVTTTFLPDPTGPGSAVAITHSVLRPPSTYCTGKTSSLGCVPFIGWNGAASATDTTPFVVRADDALPSEAGFLFYGFGKANLAFHGGKRCVKAPFTRIYPTKTAKATGTPPCSGVLTRDFNKRIQSGLDPLLTPGQRVTAQWFQRDPADPASFGDGLTDALQFRICP